MLQGCSSGDQGWAARIRSPAWRGSPSGASTLQLGKRTTWQSRAHGRCQSFYNGGLQPSNTSFEVAVTKPRLTPWLWAEDGGGGGGGRLFGRLCQAGEERDGDWLCNRFLSRLEGCAQATLPCFSLHGSHKASLLINFGLMTPKRGYFGNCGLVYSLGLCHLICGMAGCEQVGISKLCQHRCRAFQVR